MRVFHLGRLASPTSDKNIRLYDIWKFTTTIWLVAQGFTDPGRRKYGGRYRPQHQRPTLSAVGPYYRAEAATSAMPNGAGEASDPPEVA